MARSTSTLRGLWAPHCQGPWARLSLHGDGVVTVRASTIDAWLALNAALVAWDYRTRRADTGAYNCRRITGGSGYSLHAYGIAVDLNWQSNPYGPRLVTDMPLAMIEAIEAIRTNSGAVVFRWGGRYRGNKDAMHFEVVASPADIASGIRASTVPRRAPSGPVQVPAPRNAVLLPEDVLHASDDRWSEKRSHRLVFQADGNLVVYGPRGDVWSSGTAGSGADRCEMQSDGNLVIYAGTRAVWSTGTHGNPGSAAVVQDDGNFVVYGHRGALWDSRSASRVPSVRAITYRVQRGDTLGSIARRYRVTSSELARANGISNPNLIRVGQVLRIPGAGS